MLKPGSHLQHELPAEVAHGSFATFARFWHVCSYSNSDQTADIAGCPKGAITRHDRRHSIAPSAHSPIVCAP